MLEILVADDHRLLREGLRPFLRELAQDVKILEAANLDETRMAATSAGNLSLILVDLLMPGMNGVQGVAALCAEFPGVPVVILSGDSRGETVHGAIRAGAAGFIAKTVSAVGLVNALRLVLSGETCLPAADPQASDPASAPPTWTDTPRRPSPLNGISGRDREILAMVIEGLTNKEIGRRLGLREVTIKTHLRGLYRRIGASNRAQAVRIALQNGA
jgi:DNA-binding NarL/FixJ family response regulator